MKTYVTYGFFMTLCGFVVTLALYFLGYHSDPAKLQASNVIGSLAGLALGITFIILGTKARRANVPASEPFGYGHAFLAGFLITLFAALFGIITNTLYFQVINPGLSELIIQAQLDKMEARGLSSTQIEQTEKFTRFMMKPAISWFFGFFGALVSGSVISLITAAFLKRKPSDDLASLSV